MSTPVDWSTGILSTSVDDTLTKNMQFAAEFWMFEQASQGFAS